MASQNMNNEDMLKELIEQYDSVYGKGEAVELILLYIEGKSASEELKQGLKPIEKYSRKKLLHILDNIYSNGIASKFMSSGKPEDGTFGCDQGGISDLFIYFCNGKMYNYKEARSLIKRAMKNNESPPIFTRVENDRLVELKNKLMSMGFPEYDAYHILMLVDIVGGCSYAAFANDIFNSFFGKEEEFFDCFGYEMYKEVDGKRVLNANELLLDIYVFANRKKNGGKLIEDDNTLNRDLVLQNSYSPDFEPIFDGKEQHYIYTTDDGDLEKAFLMSKGIQYDKESIKEFKISHIYKLITAVDRGYSVRLSYITKDIATRSTNEDLYESLMQGTGSHAVLVTAYSDEGLYVSSWGEEHFIEFKELFNSSRNPSISISTMTPLAREQRQVL